MDRTPTTIPRPTRRSSRASAHKQGRRTQRRRHQRSRGARSAPHRGGVLHPHLAHATMEPPAATARIAKGKCEVWGCFQSPRRAATWSRTARHAPQERHCARHAARGGFGRKSKPITASRRCAVQSDGRQACQLPGRAKTPASRLLPHCLRRASGAGLDAQGRPWRGCTAPVAPTIISTFDANAKQERHSSSAWGHHRTFRNSQHPDREPGRSRSCRIGWFRSVSNIPPCVRVQSFVAELAAAAGRDQKDFLLG